MKDNPVPTSALSTSRFAFGLNTTEVGAVPLMLFVGIAAIVATSAWAGLLPKNMIGGLAVIMTLGFAFAKVGRQIPVLKDIGGPAILCLMVPSVLVYFGAFGKQTLDTVHLLMKEANLLYFVIACLVVGSILGMNRVLLIQGMMRMFVPLVAGTCMAVLSGLIVGSLFGYTPYHTFFFIIVPIIGGGIASALLSLALLHRGWQVTLYCADDAPASGASGNRQGALYPLLSAHDPALFQFFPAAFTFARRLYDTLPVMFDHEWCGVTQLGWDERSQQKIAQMLSLGLPEDIARAVSAQEAADTTGVETGCEGIQYPLGGWLCPAELTAAVIALAQSRGLTAHYARKVESLSRTERWDLRFADGKEASHASVVLANGHNISQFIQTESLPVYPVGGQVSHIPTTSELGKLRQVLCYDGYLTPQNPSNGHHCIGASYHRGETDMRYSEADQAQNRQRLIDCFPDAAWAKEVDISEGEARCGVRCATRDHLPMVGNVPDYAATLTQYASLHEQPDIADSAPVCRNLFMLGALGSRGLCTAPLSAELLAAQMSAEPLPLDSDTLAALNPNRLWVRKLLKGKAVK